MDNQPTIDKFLDELVQVDGDNFTAEQKMALKLELLSELEKRLKVVSLEHLSGETLKKFAEAIANGDFDLLAQVKFFSENIPSYEAIMNKALEDFKKEYTSLTI